VKNVKQKVLIVLEHEQDNADKELKRWNDAVKRYDADLLFVAEQGFPTNVRTVSSRNLAKEEAGRARETKRLYTIAINAVKRA
jgi:alpha-L-fucosidase